MASSAGCAAASGTWAIAGFGPKATFSLDAKGGSRCAASVGQSSGADSPAVVLAVSTQPIHDMSDETRKYGQDHGASVACAIQGMSACSAAAISSARSSVGIVTKSAPHVTR